MKSTQTTAASKSEAPAAPRVESMKRSSGERWVIRSIVVVACGLICAAICQTVGRDVVQIVRRLPVFLQAARPQPTEVTESDRFVSVDFTEDGNSSVGHGKNVLAADSMIVPPRSRKASGKSVEVVLSVNGNSFPADAMLTENRGEGSGFDKKQANADRHASRAAEGTVDLTENLLEAAARLVSLSWQDFDYPVTWSVLANSRSRMIFVSHRNRLLKGVAHLHPSTLSLDQFRKDYAVARAQFPDDPRLDYVFGLVLWKHQQFTEAIDMFQTAARLDEVPFLPAALAVAWGRFLIHDDRRGLDQLAHIARRLADTGDLYPTGVQTEQAAIAIGRALGYLTGPGRNSEIAESVELTARNILERLPERLRDACETGRHQIANRQSELMQLAALPGDRISQDHQRRCQQLQGQIDSLRREMQNARNELTRDHLSYVETVKGILNEVVDVRGETEKLRPAIQKMKDAVFKLSQPQPHVEVTVLPPHYALVTPTNTGSQGLNLMSEVVQYQGISTTLVLETASERAARVSQLHKAREELKKIENELSELRDRQRDLVASRHDSDSQDKLEKNQARRLRVARLKEQQELDQRLQSLTKAARRTTSLRDGMDAISAYVPWNVEVEGEALWLALTPKSAPPAP